MHSVTAIAVEKYNQTQVYSKKKTDRNGYAKIYYYAIIEDVKVSTKEVQRGPVGEKFVNQIKIIESEKICSSSYTDLSF